MKSVKSFIVSKLSDAQIDRIKWFGGNFKAYFAKKRNVGKDTYIEPSVHVLGWGNVRIGRNCVLGQDTVIVINKRKAGKVSVTIGDNCLIGRRNFWTAGALIKIGDYAMISNDCRILGGGHRFETPFVPYIATGTTCDDVIELGANCWLGANVTLLKGVKVGYGSIIGAGSVVNCDIPPFSVAVGNPCRVVKRFDMQSQTWMKAKDYPEDGDRYLPGEEKYLELLKKECPTTRMPTIAVTKTWGDLE